MPLGSTLRRPRRPAMAGRPPLLVAKARPAERGRVSMVPPPSNPIGAGSQPASSAGGSRPLGGMGNPIGAGDRPPSSQAGKGSRPPSSQVALSSSESDDNLDLRPLLPYRQHISSGRFMRFLFQDVVVSKRCVRRSPFQNALRMSPFCHIFGPRD